MSDIYYWFCFLLELYMSISLASILSMNIDCPRMGKLALSEYLMICLLGLSGNQVIQTSVGSACADMYTTQRKHWCGTCVDMLPHPGIDRASGIWMVDSINTPLKLRCSLESIHMGWWATLLKDLCCPRHMLPNTIIKNIQIENILALGLTLGLDRSHSAYCKMDIDVFRVETLRTKILLQWSLCWAHVCIRTNMQATLAKIC